MAANMRKLHRRQRGRPQRDYGDDDDVEVLEWAIALRAAWGLSERRALDLALAVCQGAFALPSKVPRGGKAGMLVSRALPSERRFDSRNADIRRKLQAGKLRPHREITLRIARLLLRIRGVGF
jgi:hypothetical protein